MIMRSHTPYRILAQRTNHTRRDIPHSHIPSPILHRLTLILCQAILPRRLLLLLLLLLHRSHGSSLTAFRDDEGFLELRFGREESSSSAKLILGEIRTVGAFGSVGMFPGFGDGGFRVLIVFLRSVTAAVIRLLRYPTLRFP
jgi:hypothetical protein